MQIVDSFHEISKSVSWEKSEKKYFKMLNYISIQY